MNAAFFFSEMSGNLMTIFHGQTIFDTDLTIYIDGEPVTISSLLERLAALETGSNEHNTNTGSDYAHLPDYDSISSITLSSTPTVFKTWHIADSENPPGYIQYMGFDLYSYLFEDFMRNSLRCSLYSPHFLVINSAWYIMGGFASCPSMLSIDSNNWIFTREQESRKNGIIKACGAYWQNMYTANVPGVQFPSSMLKTSIDGVSWTNVTNEETNMLVFAGSDTCLYAIGQSPTGYMFAASVDGKNWRHLYSSVSNDDDMIWNTFLFKLIYSSSMGCLNGNLLMFGYADVVEGSSGNMCNIYAITHDGNPEHDINISLIDQALTTSFERNLQFSAAIQAYGNGCYITCLNSRGFYRSTDLSHWSFISMPGYWFTSIIYHRGVFIVTAYDAPALDPVETERYKEGHSVSITYSSSLNSYVFTSKNGIDWTKRSIIMPSNTEGLVEYISDTFVYDNKLYAFDISTTPYDGETLPASVDFKLSFREVQITE